MAVGQTPTKQTPTKQRPQKTQTNPPQKNNSHLLSSLSDAAYDTVQSFHSDSAVSFSVFLNNLPDMCAQQPPDVMMRAMQDTVAAIVRAQRECGVADTSLLNFVVSDGTTLVATRFVWPESEGAATLYYAEGESRER